MLMYWSLSICEDKISTDIVVILTGIKFKHEHLLHLFLVAQHFFFFTCAQSIPYVQLKSDRIEQIKEIKQEKVCAYCLPMLFSFSGITVYKM